MSEIQHYISHFRKLFPDSVTPKIHFVEDHIIEWITKDQFVMAIHGKQSGEAIHQ